MKRTVVQSHLLILTSGTRSYSAGLQSPAPFIPMQEGVPMKLTLSPLYPSSAARLWRGRGVPHSSFAQWLSNYTPPLSPPGHSSLCPNRGHVAKENNRAETGDSPATTNRCSFSLPWALRFFVPADKEDSISLLQMELLPDLGIATYPIYFSHWRYTEMHQ